MRISDWSSDVCSSDLIYMPMHYIGILGVPRRYFALGETAFIPDSVALVNAGITIAAIVVFLAQGLFFFNMIWSLFRGPKADPNPWGAASLEWQTPDTPPEIGSASCRERVGQYV